MKHIQKKMSPPPLLEAWKAQHARTLLKKRGPEQWRRFIKGKKRKIQLHEYLLDEQGYICAYCNRRVHKSMPHNDEQLRVEHLYPKSKFPSKTLEYENLVGVCFGNEREPRPREVHCDVQKSEKELPISFYPTDPGCEAAFFVSGEGELGSRDPKIQNALTEILNLNCDKLIGLRKDALDAFSDPELEMSEKEAQKVIEEYYSTDAQGNLEPFCGIIVNYIRNNFLTP